MKFAATQSTFVEALSLVSRVVPSRPTHPILGNVLMKLESDRLTLTTFDLSLGIKASILVEGKEDGAIAVPARLLNDIVSRLPDGELKLETGENNVLHIKAGKGKYKLSWLDPQEYPELPMIEEGIALSLSASILSSTIRAVGFAASPDETKQILTGIHLILGIGCLELAATDGHRMAMAKIELPHLQESDENEPVELTPEEETERKKSVAITIPARAMAELSPLLKGVEEVEMSFDERQAVFVAGDRTLTARLLEGLYPVIHQIVPTRFERIVTVPRKELMSALERLVVVAQGASDKKTGHVVRFNIGTEAIALTAEGRDNGSGEEEVACLNTGEGILMAFNARYFLDMLRVVSTHEVQVNINEDLTPVIVTPVGVDKQTYVLMPVRIRE